MFIFLVGIDGDHNYLRCKVRSYFPLRSTTKYRKSWRGKKKEKSVLFVHALSKTKIKEQNAMTCSFIIHVFFFFSYSAAEAPLIVVAKCQDKHHQTMLSAQEQMYPANNNKWIWFQWPIVPISLISLNSWFPYKLLELEKVIKKNAALYRCSSR